MTPNPRRDEGYAPTALTFASQTTTGAGSGICSVESPSIWGNHVDTSGTRSHTRQCISMVLMSGEPTGQSSTSTPDVAEASHEHRA